MTKKKKPTTPIEKIKQAILTKISALSIFIVLIAIIINFGFLQYSKSNSNSIISDSQIAKWIDENPMAIINSVKKMQMEEAEKARKERDKIVKEKIPAKMDELVKDDLDGTFSTKKPDVNIVEFFDYNCSYCKRVESTVNKLKSEKNIRIVYKEYPILGKSSEDLSKVAIAVNLISPSKYSLFHHKLMKSNARSKEEAIKIAGKIGINVASLKSALKKHKSKIEDKIEKNRNLARELSITGTPAFIIGNQLIPGAVGIKEIKEAIKEARKNK
jgi:protein-disulfide isomerase